MFVGAALAECVPDGFWFFLLGSENLAACLQEDKRTLAKPPAHDQCKTPNTVFCKKIPPSLCEGKRVKGKDGTPSDQTPPTPRENR
jgi:hypothetical protein